MSEKKSTDYAIDFLALGPQKTATTWLYDALSGSEEICFPRGVKETFFWDKYYHRGFDWYFNHFQVNSIQVKRGEVSPTLFESIDAPKRVAGSFPACKLIITLRDPVERIFSLYLHHLRKGRVRGEFFDVIKDNPWLLEGSRYQKYITEWYKYFSKDQIQILLLENIRNLPEQTLERVKLFLELDDPKITGSKEAVNQFSLPRYPAIANFFSFGADKLRESGIYWPVQLAKKMGLKKIYKGADEIPSITSEERQYLIDEFERDISFVEKLTNNDLSNWRKVE